MIGTIDPLGRWIPGLAVPGNRQEERPVPGVDMCPSCGADPLIANTESRYPDAAISSDSVAVCSVCRVTLESMRRVVTE